MGVETHRKEIRLLCCIFNYIKWVWLSPPIWNGFMEILEWNNHGKWLVEVDSGSL